MLSNTVTVKNDLVNMCYACALCFDRDVIKDIFSRNVQKTCARVTVEAIIQKYSLTG